MPTLTSTLVWICYQGFVSLFSALSLINAIADSFHFRRPEPAAPASAAPMPALSVLIPARDEAATIGACVRSLCDQSYNGPLEILILDDGSTDGTAEVARAAANGDHRVRVFPGGVLLEGWKGKPNALRQLAGRAEGELLLLTDADCVFYRGALDAVVRHRAQLGADCLSLIPQLLCGSLWEQIVIPLQYDVIFLELPVQKVYGSPNPAFAAANGAFMLLPAATYRELGGHSTVRAEMAEDIKFSQHVKRTGRRLAYGDGSCIYAVRMYDSFGAIWAGFSKNLFPAMGSSLPILVFWVTFHLVTQILPFAFVIAAVVRGQTSSPIHFALPLIQCAIALAVRLIVTIRFRQALWAVSTHPIGWLVVIAIAINSAYLGLSRKGHTWKGRVYR